jgi:hypothetical protein
MYVVLPQIWYLTMITGFVVPINQDNIGNYDHDHL